MFKINRKVEYALMVLQFMSERSASELTTAREVCDRFGAPFDTVAKVMQHLALANVLESVKGVKGGYHLKADLAHVNLMQLVEWVEGQRFAVDCQGGSCELGHTCTIQGPLKRLNDYATAVFASLSVRDLLQEKLQTPALVVTLGCTKELA